MDDENGKWGVVEFDQDIGTPMPAGNYKAHISNITVADKTDNYWMIIEFEIIEHDEFLGYQPDTYFILLDSRVEGKQREIKKGVQRYIQLGLSVNVNLNNRSGKDAVKDLLHCKCTIKLGQTGAGINLKNPIYGIFPYEGDENV
jgi:hypothetical protein